MTTAAEAPPERLRRLTSWLLNQARVAGNHHVTERLGRPRARTDYAILATLEAFGPTSQADIGRRLGIDRSDVVALLNQLGDEHLVHRAPDELDRRRNVVTITAAGRRRLHAMDDEVTQAQDDLLQPLNQEERASLVHLLQRVVDHHRGTPPRA